MRISGFEVMLRTYIMCVCGGVKDPMQQKDESNLLSFIACCFCINSVAGSCCRFTVYTVYHRFITPYFASSPDNESLNRYSDKR